MSLNRTSIDRTTLPWSLLRLAKANMRITFDDDDQIIVHKLSHAIDLFERLSGFSVFRAQYDWAPGTLEAAPEALGLTAGSVAGLLPVRRASAWQAYDSGAVEITSQLGLWGDSNPDSIGEQYLTGASGAAAANVKLTVGYRYASELPPGIIDIVLRIASYLFEWREVQNVPGVDSVAYANSLMTGYWVPRC